MSSSSGRAPLAAGFGNGGVSFWYRAAGRPAPGPRLPGPRTADVCVVGAGYTGLWTAYYLKRARPDLRIVVLEREFAGFGASGRNGGWVLGRSPGRGSATPSGTAVPPRSRCNAPCSARWTRSSGSPPRRASTAAW